MKSLEQLKVERGGKCHNCRRFLRPDDEDHTFCNECWQLLMQHEFYASDRSAPELCDGCDEDKDDPIHTIKVPRLERCLNCGGIVFQGEDVQGLHSRCFTAFKEYIEQL